MYGICVAQPFSLLNKILIQFKSMNSVAVYFCAGKLGKKSAPVAHWFLRESQQKIGINSIFTDHRLNNNDKQYYMTFYQKQVIIEKDHEQINLHISSVLASIHKIASIAACGLYFFSTLLALPYFSSQNSRILIAKQLLFNFAILFGISQSCQIATKIKAVTKFQLLAYLVTLSGCILLALAALYQQEYNQGANYMISSFLLSVSTQLKIIQLLLPKNRIKEQRNRFLCQLSYCCSSIVFFFGAVVKETGLQAANTAYIYATVNLVSGALMAWSIIYTYRSNYDKENEGYQGITSTNQNE